eukprot:CAMPEP_0185452920 /NCGR_PEP_ID=MMETSP1365-20130426/68553_1 /TAXON_ID=38817 /ORGANISM="Gephyrocapsa oceanica, Strain RCC1303" /LENGTH=89 /DNA_ID=CAMNT_0028059143 /DNA_START=251 /DNA_END=517 /DNA_ORIENTATION=+
MSETTHTSNSPESGSGMETVPPEGSAAARTVAAPPPSDSLQGRTWGSASSGDGEAEHAGLGLRDPDWLVEPGLGGATEHIYPLGCEAAT